MATFPPSHQSLAGAWMTCWNDMSNPIIRETRTVIPAKSGQKERVAYAHQREGTCSLFMFFQPLGNWRQGKVTTRRTVHDDTACLKAPGAVHFPDASIITVVQDNLSTHTPAVLYTVFSSHEACRIINRLDMRDTPKHNSWQNMAEIEIGILLRHCLDQRIPAQASVRRMIALWERKRNTTDTTVNYQFTTGDTRTKLRQLYPQLLEQGAHAQTEPLVIRYALS